MPQQSKEEVGHRWQQDAPFPVGDPGCVGAEATCCSSSSPVLPANPKEPWLHCKSQVQRLAQVTHGVTPHGAGTGLPTSSAWAPRLGNGLASQQAERPAQAGEDEHHLSLLLFFFAYGSYDIPIHLSNATKQ